MRHVPATKEKTAWRDEASRAPAAQMSRYASSTWLGLGLGLGVGVGVGVGLGLDIEVRVVDLARVGEEVLAATLQPYVSQAATLCSQAATHACTWMPRRWLAATMPGSW